MHLHISPGLTDGRYASTPRQAYIYRETENLVSELMYENPGACMQWKRLQLDGAEDQCAQEWDEARAVYEAAYSETAGDADERQEIAFEAVFAETLDRDLAEYVWQAVETERLVAEQTEELTVRKRMESMQ